MLGKGEKRGLETGRRKGGTSVLSLLFLFLKNKETLRDGIIIFLFTGSKIVMAFTFLNIVLIKN